jgi:hypothetical protein
VNISNKNIFLVFSGDIKIKAPLGIYKFVKAEKLISSA